jgi:integrase
LWVAVGANLLQVSRWLGHSTVQITADVYGHLFPETNDLVIGRLDRALRDALPRSDERLTTGNASP